MKTIVEFFSDMNILDVLDICLVWVILYFAYKFIRERRAGKLAVGVLLLIFIQLVSNYYGLRAMQFLLQNIFQVGLIAIIIVFQPELRSALEKFGGEPFRSIKNLTEQKDTAEYITAIDGICEAVCDMSLDKTGALIVIERSTKLGEFIRSGTEINADITPFLIKNIFFNKAPLHDGAMIIRGVRIIAAGCFLPLSTNTDIVRDIGTRHRAAIGMSENSDAVVIVVSEETGVISIAENGRLTRNYDYTKLRKELINMIVPAASDKMKQLRKKMKQEDGESENHGEQE